MKWVSIQSGALHIRGRDDENQPAGPGSSACAAFAEAAVPTQTNPGVAAEIAETIMPLKLGAVHELIFDIAPVSQHTRPAGRYSTDFSSIPAVPLFPAASLVRRVNGMVVWFEDADPLPADLGSDRSYKNANHRHDDHETIDRYRAGPRGAAARSRARGSHVEHALRDRFRSAGRLYPPALLDRGNGQGLTPGRLWVVRADAGERLRAAAECMACRGVGAVVLPVFHSLTRVQARRLQLAAERGGGLAVLLRPRPLAHTYAAATRWLVSPTPGTRLAQRWSLELLHGHGRPVGQILTLEQRRDTAKTLFSLHLPPLLADRQAVPKAS
jgi:cell division inhibitor SulA